jgi:hypothetical protein
MKTWLRKGFIAITLSLSSVVCCSLLIEVVVRVSGLLELQPSTTHFSATKGYELTPDHKNINSHGLRDREFPLTKPTRTFRILALGDSFTYGYAIKLEETYVKR